MLNADLVTRAICSGFFKAPAECDDLLAPRDPLVKYQGAPPATGVSVGTVLLALISIAASVGCTGFFYRYVLSKSVARQVREQVMLEVESQMEVYNKLPSEESLL